MQFKENNPDCLCCDPTTEEPCGVFSDNFNRADSSEVGNEWVGDGDIKNQRLEIRAVDVISPVNGGPGRLIQATVYFSGNNQEFRLYWAGTGNYVGFRPTNFDSSTKRNIYIFANGAMQSSAFFGNGTLSLGVPYTISVCVDNNSAESHGVRYASSSMPSGAAGVGAVGSFSNGPIQVDDFAVRLASDACHDCDASFADCMNECSGEFSWLLDLSGFQGMVENARDTNPFDCDCHDLGSYLLEPNGFCSWYYTERYCNQAWGCAVSLSISLIVNANHCSAELAIGITNIPCFSVQLSQQAVYRADDYALATVGNGVVTFKLDPVGQTFGRKSYDNTGTPPTFTFPVCVGTWTFDPSGVDRFTSIPCPATVTATRVG